MPEDFILNLPSGETLKGSKDLVISTAKDLGYDMPTLFPETEWYLSDSRGYIKLADMHTAHLKNAYIKQYVKYLRSLSALADTGKQFILESIYYKDPILAGLNKELITREEVEGNKE